MTTDCHKANGPLKDFGSLETADYKYILFRMSGLLTAVYKMT